MPVIFVKVAPTPEISPEKVVAVTTPTALIPPAKTLIPVLAVMIPKESILVTSSYVSSPPIDTSPLTFNEVKVPKEVTLV